MKRVFKYLLIIIGMVSLWIGTFYISKTYMFKKSVNNEQKNEEVVVNPIEKEVYPKVHKLSMIMTGDALIHGSVYKDAHIGNNIYDFTKQVELIKPIIQKYDLAYYNQETIIGGKDLGLSSYPMFNSPDEIGDCMLDAGFNLISLATNHTLDKGEKGVLYSTNYWKQKKNVLAVGSYDSIEARNTPVIKEKNGITYTMLSYTTVTNGLYPPTGKDYLTNIFTYEKAKTDIENVRDKVDLLIVAMHWGQEYTHTPVPLQKELANYFSKLGVDIIIGTHPHVLEPIEYVGDTLVIYSLGNFISAQIGIDKLTGALLSLDVTKTINEDKTSEIQISNINAELIYTYYKNWKDFKVIPYKDLTDEILPNYRNHYEKYSNVLKQYDNTIPVTSLE